MQNAVWIEKGDKEEGWTVWVMEEKEDGMTHRGERKQGKGGGKGDRGGLKKKKVLLKSIKKKREAAKHGKNACFA